MEFEHRNVYGLKYCKDAGSHNTRSGHAKTQQGTALTLHWKLKMPAIRCSQCASAQVKWLPEREVSARLVPRIRACGSWRRPLTVRGMLMSTTVPKLSHHSVLTMPQGASGSSAILGAVICSTRMRERLCVGRHSSDSICPPQTKTVYGQPGFIPGHSQPHGCHKT